MANREACELWIEQEIESGLEEGKTPYKIGKEISDWVARLFEVRISPHTIVMRAHRSKDKIITNVIKKSTNKSEDYNLEKTWGGKREGSGRPSKNQLLIELNQKLSELAQKENEYRKLEQASKTYIRNNPDLQASIMYAVIIGGIEIIENSIDLAIKNRTASHIPGKMRVELINRWGKISKYLNEKIGEVN